MAKPAAKTTVAPVKEAPLVASNDAPDYLKNYKGPKTNTTMETEDLIIPRIKLLQGISPEVTAYESAKAGMFWHNVLNTPIGDDFRFIPVMSRKHYILFAPRGDARSVLARAPDARNWQPANQTFEVKLKGVPKPIKWTTKDTVAQSRLADFGSSNPDDPQSPPAATLIYEFLAFLPDHPEFSPAIISLARSGIKRGKNLNSSIELRATRVPQFAQLYRATHTEEKGAEGPYLVWQFASDGVATEPDFNAAVALADRFKATSFRAADEDLSEEAAPDTSDAGAGSKEY